MNGATLLIVVLSNAGYWFGGEPAQVTLRWAVAPPEQAAFVWELHYGQTVLGAGEIPLPRGEAESTLRIETPPVRVRTPLHLSWRVVGPGAGEAMDSGQMPVVLFPGKVLEPLPALLRGEPLLVLDDEEGLPRLLDAAKAPYRRLDSLDDLSLHRRGVVLIGPGQVAAAHGPFSASSLMDAARRGMRVMAFQQEAAARLAELTVTPRLAPRALQWRVEHPLFRGLAEVDLASWCIGVESLPAVRIAADTPALELAFWPGESKAGASAPVDAAVLTRTVDEGRVVLWQLPLGDWTTDPRSQTLLVNAMDYLLSPPQATPPPGDRQAKANGQHPALPEEDRP